tara:strand:+ start:3317 stop:3598 length:282 start_codon:yes stop_codon:yes gene_type:complete
MTVQELMERCANTQTGRMIAYIKDGLEEINIEAETHVDMERIDIVKNKRFYDIPSNMTKMVDVRVKNHFNSKNEYRSIPRMVTPPKVTDEDNV